MPGRWGVLLVNLGTPDAPRTREVRRYLYEFLSDPRVLDVHPLLRWFLVHAVIVPWRAPRSAEAYRKIWTEGGSPLLLHGRELARKVSARLGPEVPVELAMRYRNPPVAGALARLRERGADRIALFPLFPQNASSAWGSAVDKVLSEARRFWDVPALQVVPPFYDHPAFLESFAAVARAPIASFAPDRVLMSFHGLPERQVLKSDPTGAHCLRSPACCDALIETNRSCYRAQCFATARSIAAWLALPAGGWEVTFQSRLGREPWIRPYTDRRVIELAREGVKRLAVLSPAFVADCLETLEELGLRARESFLAQGGEELLLVPSLNSDDVWADTVVRILQESTGLGRHR